MNAEIVHRLEDYERINRAYTVATTDPFVQRVCILIARAVSFLDEIVERDGQRDKVEEVTRRERQLDFCPSCFGEIFNYEGEKSVELPEKEARKQSVIQCALYALYKIRDIKGMYSEFKFYGYQAKYAADMATSSVRNLLPQIHDLEARINILTPIAESQKGRDLHAHEGNAQDMIDEINDEIAYLRAAMEDTQ